jgi:hypothetical protein
MQSRSFSLRPSGLANKQEVLSMFQTNTRSSQPIQKTAEVPETGRTSAFDCDNDLVDNKTDKLRDGVSRLENAMYFLEQIKNPSLFRVGDDIVELCFAGEDSLSDVLAKHFSRRMQQNC